MQLLIARGACITAQNASGCDSAFLIHAHIAIAIVLSTMIYSSTLFIFSYVDGPH
jgi:hypothetical protein